MSCWIPIKLCSVNAPSAKENAQWVDNVLRVGKIMQIEGLKLFPEVEIYRYIIYLFFANFSNFFGIVFQEIRLLRKIIFRMFDICMRFVNYSKLRLRILKYL